MRSLFPPVVCFTLAACFAAGQSLRLNGSKVVLPDGHVVGAAFLNGELIVQQTVLRAEGAKINSSRRILIWELKANAIVDERSLGDGRSPLLGNDCGRVVAESVPRVILVCVNGQTLASLSATSLQFVSTIHLAGKIFDFAVDEAEKRVFIVWQSDSNDQYLTAFDLASSHQLEEVKISSGVLAGAQIGVDTQTKRVAVAQSLLGRTGYTTNLIGCGYAHGIKCGRAVVTGQTMQIGIVGQEVLLASGLFANDRHACLTSVNLVTREVTHDYCAPQTGVHYGVGIVGQRYVVGYTGVQKWMAWKEYSVKVGSSVSVWRYEDGRVAAEAAQDKVPASFLGGARIAASSDASRFLLYSETSNVAYVYTIEELAGNP
ncbi:MAG: hypothetical protein ACRD1L_08810 [Terriglobales bacterium]